MPSDPGARSRSRSLVLAVVEDHGPLTRSEIVRRTGLARATVARAIADLRGSGRLLEDDAAGEIEGRGRRPGLLHASPDTRVAVGIDLGHRHLTAALGTLRGDVIAEERREVPEDDHPGSLSGSLPDLLRSLLDRAGRAADDVVGTVLGVPAPIMDGRVVDDQILPLWRGIDVPALLGTAVGGPVAVENDANLGVWGEVRGVRPSLRDVIYVKVSSGIGAGIVSGGVLLRGDRGRAGEIGHLSLRTDGRVCRCGNRGCLETVSSVPSMVRDLAQAHAEVGTAEDLRRLLHAGDPPARRVVRDAGEAVGQALAGPVSLLSPRAVVVGGGVVDVGDDFLDGLEIGLSRFVRQEFRSGLDLRHASFGDRNEIIGALWAAIGLRTSTLIGQRGDADAVIA
ncbi:ROK family transcriptional regulator [Nocardioides fonticola]|uniref:ROK family transcriptional regulator n=1 Tax=Nocardioides fonticola TaxID=450363 RepID=A0ABP7XK41_9ACTN